MSHSNRPYLTLENEVGNIFFLLFLLFWIILLAALYFSFFISFFFFSFFLHSNRSPQSFLVISFLNDVITFFSNFSNYRNIKTFCKWNIFYLYRFCWDKLWFNISSRLLGKVLKFWKRRRFLITFLYRCPVWVSSSWEGVESLHTHTHIHKYGNGIL